MNKLEIIWLDEHSTPTQIKFFNDDFTESDIREIIDDSCYDIESISQIKIYHKDSLIKVLYRKITFTEQ